MSKRLKRFFALCVIFYGIEPFGVDFVAKMFSFYIF